MKKLSMFLSTLFCCAVLFQSIGCMDEAWARRGKPLTGRDAAIQKQENRINEIRAKIFDPSLSQEERDRLNEEWETGYQTLGIMRKNLL